MDDWLITVLIVLAIALVAIGWPLYEARVGKPNRRRKALEDSLKTLADHNVEIAYQGSSRRIAQAKHLRSPNDPISVIDLLNRDSELNQGGDWKKLTFHEGFHQGPFADELTDQEWQFVHQRYTELVKEKTSNRITVETHQKLLKENEERLEKLTSTYVEQARAIAERGSDHNRSAWDETFDALNNDHKKDRDGKKDNDAA